MPKFSKINLRAIAMKIFNAPSGVLSSIGIALVSRARIHQEIERAPVVLKLRHSVENLKSIVQTFKSRVETLENKLREQNNLITELELRLTKKAEEHLAACAQIEERLVTAEKQLAAFAQIDELSREGEHSPDVNRKH
jgi:hypothetical protein